ncbi:hypothetical protein RHMOL_Rhmol06G0109200 [Rhododendron molle]|uniref:Uncharacterized protein n=1 Tax=Rhododendron molle TaxID=49168 RepID=A0ACC0NCL7_RHOML|nr:hypothetical protein RHMOL_Rhmol06G0109200 [Rhododendron molle]
MERPALAPAVAVVGWPDSRLTAWCSVRGSLVLLWVSVFTTVGGLWWLGGCRG